MKKYEGVTKVGEFQLSPDESILGQLTLTGASSALELHSNEPFHVFGIEHGNIRGILTDKEKVSLIDCIPLVGTGHGSRAEETYHFARLYPHFAIFGDDHITNTEEKISSLHVIVEDATTLFYDFDAFGTSHDETSFVENIIKSRNRDYPVEIGPSPIVMYFTGKLKIFEAETILGNISASHNISYSFPSPAGFSLKNEISINIEFRRNVCFGDAISDLLSLLPFFEIIVGRTQNILSLKLNISSIKESPEYLDVYWCMPPKRCENSGGTKPHPGDVLIDSVRQPQCFSNVLASWLERKIEWSVSRARFSQSFSQPGYYTVDRLVGAANNFDLLPDQAVGSANIVSKELSEALDTCRAIFKELPQTSERDSVLSAFGRVRQNNLKNKVKNRARLLQNPIEHKLPDFEFVIDAAVDYRNYFVHGTSHRVFSTEGEFRFLSFFTDTLEFIFAGSDLVDAGWDVKEWSARSAGIAHPFANYIVGYDAAYREVKELLSKPP